MAVRCQQTNKKITYLKKIYEDGRARSGDGWAAGGRRRGNGPLLLLVVGQWVHLFCCLKVSVRCVCVGFGVVWARYWIDRCTMMLSLHVGILIPAFTCFTATGRKNGATNFQNK